MRAARAPPHPDRPAPDGPRGRRRGRRAEADHPNASESPPGTRGAPGYDGPAGTLEGSASAPVRAEPLVGSGAPLADNEVHGILDKLNLRPQLAAREEAILARYIYDIRRALSEVARVLTPGGKAVYVVGENTIRGTYVRNASIVAMAASLSGLKLCDRRTRALPSERRYLPPPLASLDFHGREFP